MPPQQCMTSTHRLKLPDVSYPKVLSTLTTILIMLDVKERQPLAFESFVELLFDIVSNVNSSSDRVLRGKACKCLQELEETYPGNFLV